MIFARYGVPHACFLDRQQRRRAVDESLPALRDIFHGLFVCRSISQRR